MDYGYRVVNYVGNVDGDWFRIHINDVLIDDVFYYENEQDASAAAEQYIVNMQAFHEVLTPDVFNQAGFVLRSADINGNTWYREKDDLVFSIWFPENEIVVYSDEELGCGANPSQNCECDICSDAIYPNIYWEGIFRDGAFADLVKYFECVKEQWLSGVQNGN